MNMNNADYAADQILNYLLKGGWITNTCATSNYVKTQIEHLIVNAAISNIDIADALTENVE